MRMRKRTTSRTILTPLPVPLSAGSGSGRPRNERTYSSPVMDELEARRSNKVVNIQATTQLQVVLVKPERFENASEIADHLREKRTVVLNLESTNKEIARRLLDFLSGVAYANEGKIKRWPSPPTLSPLQCGHSGGSDRRAGEQRAVF